MTASTPTATALRVPSRAVQTALGWLLLCAPAVVLFAVQSSSGSAALAAVSALSLSSTIQLVGERYWPARPLAPHTGAQLAVEGFQGLVYGMVLGVSTIFAASSFVSLVKSALGFSFVLALPVWGQALVLVVVADFLDYFRHRHEHESDGLFWRVHSVHHSIREFSLVAGLAVHPLEPVFTFASYGFVAGLFGLSSDATILGFTIAMIAMGAQHANTCSRLGWLSNVVAHIDGHRWHHDMALSTGRNVNYANVFSIWDRLWGTFQPAAPFDGDYGIEPFRDDYPKDLIGQAKMALPGEYAQRVRDLELSPRRGAAARGDR
jgi:sterol desaturase/sphingolipid hydroxylase (fatty acid hydroxylase superfamily)